MAKPEDGRVANPVGRCIGKTCESNVVLKTLLVEMGMNYDMFGES